MQKSLKNLKGREKSILKGIKHYFLSKFFDYTGKRAVNHKSLFIGFLIGFCLFNLIIIYILFQGVIFIITDPEIRTDLKVITYELNESEIQQVKIVLRDVKPMYLSPTRELKIYKEFPESFWSKSTSLGNNFKTKGQNTAQFISVEYGSNPLIFKEFLCHELLHNYIFVPNEAIVYDLDNYMPCYLSSMNQKGRVKTPYLYTEELYTPINLTFHTAEMHTREGV